MPEQYFIIPLPHHPALVEAQNFLRRRLEGARFVDPATFHITLVVVEDTKGAELAATESVANLPVFGVGSWGIDTFSTEEGYAIHLRLSRSAALTYLQAALYYRAVALGAKIGEHSYPGSYRPHITLAYTNAEPDYSQYEEVHLEVTRYLLADPDYVPVAEWGLQTEVAVQEMAGDGPAIQLQEASKRVGGKTQITLHCVSEMRGKYPDIHLPPDIDRKAIQEKGRKFVTLPLGQVDARSNNGRTYRRQAVEQLTAQINAQRPEGAWGHTKPENMGTEYQPPAIRWLAAQLDANGVVWGKGLPLTDQAQEYFELAKATNARVGTSLQAWASLDGEDVSELELIKLDLADPARVGVPITAALPQLSTEMTDAGNPACPEPADGDNHSTGEAIEGELSDTVWHNTTMEEKDMDEDKQPPGETAPAAGDQRLAERERQHTQELLALHQQLNEQRGQLTQLEALAELLDNPEDVVAATRKLTTELAAVQLENQALLRESIEKQVEKAVAIPDCRPLIEELVRTEKPSTRAEVEQALEAVLQREYVKTLLKRGLQEQSGPRQGRPVDNPANGSAVESWFENPELT